MIERDALPRDGKAGPIIVGAGHFQNQCFHEGVPTLEQRLTSEAQEPLIARNRQAMRLMTATALVEPLWILDVDRIRVMARGALEEPAVHSLRLTGSRPLRVCELFNLIVGPAKSRQPA